VILRQYMVKLMCPLETNAYIGRKITICIPVLLATKLESFHEFHKHTLKTLCHSLVTHYKW